MTIYHGIGLLMAGYLVLVGRNAYKQGEFGKFAFSLALVTGMGLVLAGIIYGYLALTGRI
jgi:hypothetical protein